jgi:ribose 5-phosphate isomerase B
MNIYVGADHRGFELKGRVVAWLQQHGYDVVDMGPMSYRPLDDYNDTAVAVCQKVAGGYDSDRGILLCGSSQGEMMQANRFRGIRAVNPRTVEETTICRQHHAANVLCIAADVLDEATVEQMIEVFMETPFGEEDKYRRRIAKLDGVF